MEELLLGIVKEASGPKLQNLKQSAQIALDKLIRQHGKHRDASYELRKSVLIALQIALENKKFISVALNGMHRLIRDERFFLSAEPENDEMWVPSQILTATNAILTTGNEDTIVNVLRLFLAIACSQHCTLNGRILIEILSRCGDCWTNHSRCVKAASLAAASALIRTFCNFLKDEADELQKTTPSGTNPQLAAAVYNEVLPVMSWLCSKLVEPITVSPNKKRPESQISIFIMECILTLTSALPKEVNNNPHFTAFLWKNFCPTLVQSIGTPGRFTIDKKFSYKDAVNLIENENRGYFIRKGLHNLQSIRCIYLTAVQLLRIAGGQASLRPMLEALFHRILIFPNVGNRSEPLKCVREMFKSPERIIDMTVLYPDKNSNCTGDMELFRLIMDSMEECATSNSTFNVDLGNSLYASLECCCSLLQSLQTLCTGDVDNIISDQVTTIINNKFSSLESADYTGPTTYQSYRLPKDYQQIVASMEIKQGLMTDSESENEQHEIESNCSGETAGPDISDTGDNSSEDIKSDMNWFFSNLEEFQIDMKSDRDHAKEFAKILRLELVPKLLKLRTSVEIDECIQQFASNICIQNCLNFSDFDYNLTAINADGIYLVTYKVFILSLQLMNLGHYAKSEGQISIPISEQGFVQQVQNCGILVLLSSVWLRELYQSILISNPLECLEKTIESREHCQLIDMIADQSSCGYLSDFKRLQTVSKFKQEKDNDRQIAAKKLARRLLTCCWDSLITILSSGLEVQDSKANRLLKISKKTLSTNLNKKKNNGESVYTLSLEGLHSVATLSNSLQLQHLAGKVLNLIATNVCSSESPKISVASALSMEVVLSGGLELGAISPDCWSPIFSICRCLGQFEHDLFSSQNVNGSNMSASINANDSPQKNSSSNSANYIIDDDETCVDVYSFLQAPLQNPNASVSSILKNYTSKTNQSQILNASDAAKVLAALSQLTDNLFSDAVERLNMPSLCNFMRALCRASREQLRENTNNKKGKSFWLGRPWKVKNSLPLSLLLHRVGDVTLKVFKSSRPLLHILKIWAIAGPELCQSACHKERQISKRAVEYIHDIIISMLAITELPHFHFNETLLKPFENLLNIETLDMDVQDQIFTCLYEIVEAYKTEIRSGWRPLFGCLRPFKGSNRLSNVIDIFRVFLETDNTLVFANAGLDCILCLLAYLEVQTADDENTSSPQVKNGEFLHDVLKFLERCFSILSFIFQMAKSPNLHSTYKIKGINYTHLIDANIPNSMENFQYFGNEYLQNVNEEFCISYRSLHIDSDTLTKLEELDKSSGVLKVWFLLLDGLTNSLIVAPNSHQSPIIQTIFKLFKSLIDPPTRNFGFYCINHLMLPMIQDWLRYINKTAKNWYSLEKNFKLTVSMTTDLVVQFIEKSVEQSDAEKIYETDVKKQKCTRIRRPIDNLKYAQIKKGLVTEDETTTDPSRLDLESRLALKQLALVLVEITAQPNEKISRIGVSCLKHVTFSLGEIFNSEEWEIVCSAIHRASTVNLAPLRQLSFAFYENSESFYGNGATVKIVARRDCTLEEINRIYSLSTQVFLMDNQREATNPKNHEIKIIHEDRNFSFLLYNNDSSTTDNGYVLRIPYKNLLVGLLASQFLLQLIANILLASLKCVPSELHSVIYDYYTLSASSSGIINNNNANKKPQFKLAYRSREILYRCLRQYLQCSLEFDYRPGLKFLIQKVSNIDCAANLYKQTSSAFILSFLNGIDSYMNDIQNLNLKYDDLKYIIESCTKVDKEVKKKEFFIRNFFSVRDIWNMISELYLKIVQIQADFNDSLANSEINIVENKLELLETELNNDVCETGDKSEEENPLQKTASEESVSILAKTEPNTNPFHNNTPLKVNPFNVTPERQKQQQLQQQQQVPLEIEQQRRQSLFEDEKCKLETLKQLLIATIELMRLIPEEENGEGRRSAIKLLFTPKISEALAEVEKTEKISIEKK